MPKTRWWDRRRLRVGMLVFVVLLLVLVSVVWPSGLQAAATTASAIAAIAAIAIPVRKWVYGETVSEAKAKDNGQPVPPTLGPPADSSNVDLKGTIVTSETGLGKAANSSREASETKKGRRPNPWGIGYFAASIAVAVSAAVIAYNAGNPGSGSVAPPPATFLSNILLLNSAGGDTFGPQKIGEVVYQLIGTRIDSSTYVGH